MRDEMTQVAIGLGCNVGDRFKGLSRAVDFLHLHPQLHITQRSPIYETPALLPENAPRAWDMPFYNQVIVAETLLEPDALLALLKACETHLGRQDRGRWGPREMDCDLLLYGDSIIDTPHLQVPHPHMAARAFVLAPLADIAPEWEVPDKGRIYDLCAAHNDMKLKKVVPKRPGFVGIVNITPDSFSDGGSYALPPDALRQITALLAAGASVIDLGAESTRPGATLLSAQDECARLKPVIDALPKRRNWLLSVDTYHPETAALAMAHGVDWLNDVSGLRDARMLEILASTDASVVAMHSLTIPADPAELLPEDVDPIAEVAHWAEAVLLRAEKAGIARARVILDPGIGFGKSKRHSLALVHRFAELKELFPKNRWLVGHSRKSYLTLFGDIPPAARDALTYAHSLLLAHQGADYLRVHDVAGHSTKWGGDDAH
jgi:2-amino-4-hydroxy-6-hydroxymethyldihydropteridine diphosphokinase/dihydropteroate synthase